MDTRKEREKKRAIDGVEERENEHIICLVKNREIFTSIWVEAAVVTVVGNSIWKEEKI